MSQIKRKFKIQDDVLFQYTQVMLRFYTRDVNEFEGFDSQLDAQKAVYFQQLVDETILMTDDQIRAKQGYYTKLLVKQVKTCDTLFRRLRYFIKKAFRNKPANQHEFGLHLYNRVKNNHAKFNDFMKLVAESTHKYQQVLEQSGAYQSFLDELIAETDKLGKAYHNQQRFKLNRKQITAERIKNLNEIWEFIQQVNEAAGFLFEHKPQKRLPYIPPRNRPKKRKNSQAISVPRNSQVQVLDNVLAAGESISIKNTGKVPLAFFFTQRFGGSLPKSITWLMPQQSIVLTPTALANGSYPVLVALNRDTSRRGSFVLNES